MLSQMILFRSALTNSQRDRQAADSHTQEEIDAFDRRVRFYRATPTFFGSRRSR